jgi:general secretion pathway protein K
MSGVKESRVSRWRRALSRKVRREAGVALLMVTVTVAVMGAVAGDMAYNARVDLEAAANSRDMLRAEYLARSAMQLGQLLITVQGGLQRQMQALPPEIRDLIVITDYADFLAKAFGGDDEARAGLGGLIGLDLAGAEGLGSGKGTNLDLEITSEEGKYLINCGGGGVNPNPQQRQNLYLLLDKMIRPQRYSRMFNIEDRDKVIISYEDLPRAIIDWVDVDQQRYEPLGNATASEERYDRGQDRYEAHHHHMDTIEELALVRGVSEDFWAAFGEMFTVYGSSDCRVLSSAMRPESWPLVAAMIAASSPDPAVVFAPNTALVAQQVAGVLKSGLPLLKNMGQQLKIEPCKVDARQCQVPGQGQGQGQGQGLQPVRPQPVGGKQGPQGGGDSIELLSNLICSPYIAQLPALGQGLSSALGGSAPPPPPTQLQPVPLCPGRLAQYLRDGSSGGSGGGGRRFFRIDAKGTVQRGPNKSTQIHIRGVWDAQNINANPLCTNHPSCNKGTWVYWRMD